ncbi:uncharacterized protein LOC106143160 [Amyelois transitella]|uniref:uncharacterized protein LOC106143160 n=1 Tax=Amyelois transitella TaxID=680683 RepID=UPI00067D1E8B|nr:uncharacterized protein LOC106143160 [Amyelois transitella]XP_060800594.1 uncharacterized protein LOC106143160 [Amyelois transitella]
MNNTQTTTNKDEAEVFVLSPNVLEKLGIDISNITHNVQEQKQVKRKKNKFCVNNSSYSNPEGIENNVSESSKNNEESSILETAKLMNDSIFLSPTFLPLVVDAKEGEDEIANQLDLISNEQQSESITTNEIYSKVSNLEHVNFEVQQDKQRDIVLSSKYKSDSRVLKETNPSIICNKNVRNHMRIPLAVHENCVLNKQTNSNDIICSKLKLDDGEMAKSKCRKEEYEPYGLLNPNDSIQSIHIPKQDNSQTIQIIYDSDTNSINHKIESESVKARSIPDDLMIPISSSVNPEFTNTADIVLDGIQSFIDQNFIQTQEPHYIIATSSASELIKNVNEVSMETVILQEPEIVIPVLPTEDIHILDNEINRTNGTVFNSGKELHNERREKDVFISLSPQLPNISNLSKNIVNTQENNINFLCESLDEKNNSSKLEITSIDQHEKLINLNLHLCNLQEVNQNNFADLNASNHIECEETSDMELDHMLHETEILTSTPLAPPDITNAPISDKENKQLYETCVMRVERDDVIESKSNISTVTNTKATHPIEVNRENIAKQIDDSVFNIPTPQNSKVVFNQNLLISHDKMFDFKNTKNLGNISPSGKPTNKNIIFEKKSMSLLDCPYKDYAQEFSEGPKRNIVTAVDNNNFIYNCGKNYNMMEDFENLPNSGNDLKVIENVRDKVKGNISTETLCNNHSFIKSSAKVGSIGMLLTSKTAGNEMDLSCHRLNNENFQPGYENKAQEIAKYLKQAYQRRAINRGVQILKPKLGSIVKSKIFIHGVEKPGGSYDCKLDRIKIKKTYEKKKNQVKKSVPCTIKEISFKSINNPEDICIEIKTCIDSSLTKRQEYCLCGDFGKLTHIDGLYEHIHFGSNKSVNCPISTVFEIYNEYGSFSDIERKEYIQEKEDCHECDTDHICWQKFEYFESKSICEEMQLNHNTGADNEMNTQICTEIHKQSVISSENKTAQEKEANDSEEITENLTELIIIDESIIESQEETVTKEREGNMLVNKQNTNEDNVIETTDVLKLNKKRKITNDPEEPAIIKCGVCKQIFAESEWNSHISKEHCYIAWEEGHNFDFDNLLLMKKIKNKLQTKGSLICTFCGFEYVKLAKFLAHVKKCYLKKISTFTLDNEKPTPTNSICKCGVCQLEVSDVNWIDHISKEHQYLAWKDGDSPLKIDDENEVNSHLLNIVKKYGHLICAKCGLLKKYTAKSIKKYLMHIETCNIKNANESSAETEQSADKPATAVKAIYKCAVCEEDVDSIEWFDHISLKHNYRAWKEGEKAPNFEDKQIWLDHLKEISRKAGCLKCSKCGLIRKYPKPYLYHVTNCDGKKIETDNGKNTQRETKKEKEASPKQDKPDDEAIICGVCRRKLRINQWMSHMRMHNYIAWKDKQASVKGNDHRENRLRAVIAHIQELDCFKCGYKSDDVTLYRKHIDSCASNSIHKMDPPFSEATELAQEGFYECAMCQEKVKYGEWKKHAVDKHYNVAWVVGDEPIDIFNQNLIAKLLKEYLQYGRYICKVCGITRSSGIGFFAHTINCGLSEQEAERFKLLCDICDTKYLGFYQSQHMVAHSQKELNQGKKREQESMKKEKEKKEEEITVLPGRRRAAAKARMVIEETVSLFKHVCDICSFATDVEEEMAVHRCPKRRKKSEDIDLSLEPESSSDDEDNVSEADENIDEEIEDEVSVPEKKRHNDYNSPPRIPRIPFVVSDLKKYFSKNVKDTADFFLTTETLFPQWTECNYKAVPEDKLLKILPPLEKSCQVFSHDKWSTYDRWTAVTDKDKTTIFVGYSIQRLSWVPSHVSVAAHSARNLLAAACHAGPDTPQYNVDELPEHPTLIQIWDFGDFQKTVPKLVFGLVLHFGTVWAMDWCPSGARAELAGAAGCVRLGLLAVACSNGTAYILSVPYPSTLTSETIFYELEPVAQLRFSTKLQRQKYQATSICWSMQKGHGTVIVGYSDGTTAYYDLNTESPLLKSQENNVDIFYPFNEERVHNGCITDVSSFPVARDDRVGAVSTASATGSALTASGAQHCARLRSHLASHAAAFLPAWPSACFAGEDVITNLSANELEYWCLGRRIGPAQCCCGCNHCALMATYMAPFVRLVRAHQTRSDVKKQPVAWISLKRLGKKRKHSENKKEVTPEPLTYEDAVTKYGIEFKLINKLTDQNEYKMSLTHYKEINPECFPISEIRSMAFCPSAKHHKRLALATHSGIIFLLKV